MEVDTGLKEIVDSAELESAPMVDDTGPEQPVAPTPVNMTYAEENMSWSHSIDALEKVLKSTSQ